ncbi:MAG: 4'-phosphopantetheinyl transferase superfamily protein [Gammaproteobacteria bacterium]|nr:4'-phosphopantetheinyl transferase superfamily protein [Gammaproteobacteria bacterium]NIR97879.1 4'-phosphopantetheinyl transferase superfamily protein [Gammaproteobacteria bacterium]NIT63584.1 4'-phosphopantetheinyl transferase superfamily protein [Gammaproteobacteria bacterium]NIV20520.1 4'-phosphopantetheinyl transferase superfamily protein [Gammaproteobacteria bacterium]NIX11114.1 4'-phosphopantetheinyl transferase superfamily protein [Gammaproteobacteria bacterium]
MTASLEWAAVAEQLTNAPPLLGPHEVHVWSFGLETSSRTVDALIPLLDERQQARAGRLHPGIERERYVVAHATTRRILGHYLDSDPARLALEYGPHGKPVLAAPPASLHFNLSHSARRALLAVSRVCEVGVDLESLQRRFDPTRLAERFFTPPEVAELQGLPPAERPAGFLRAWTRKEALVKAMGLGITVNLRRLRVSLDPDRLSWWPMTPDILAADWELHDLPAIPSFVAALAARGKDWALRCWELS